jgi:hypothetical protein
VSRRVRVVEASLTVILGTAYGGSRRETTVGGASGNLVSLVGREVADVFSTRHPEGPPKWWASTYYYSHYALSQLVFLNTPYVRKLVLG